DAPDDAPADDATDAEHPARTETEAAATAGEGAEPPPDVDAPRGEPAAVPAEAEAAGGDGLAAGPGATFSGPQSDQEMPLADHIEEMVRRLAVVVLVAAGVSALVLPLGDTIVTWLWDSILVDTTARPHLYSPPELIITQIKVASLAGLVVALPVVVYESYLFMRPGLYPHERRYFLAAVPTSLVLAFVGLTFGYFVVLPAVFTYFLRYSEETATIAFALSSTLDLILVLMGYLAVVFQIPLFVMLALVMGLVTRRWLVRRRLLFWGSFAGISFFFSPDPTGVSPLIIAATMISLFEGTLFLARWTKAGQRT
ncbi:MAG: twin-arginine translocase subunit TatC, partial [Halobacteriaceae archaeon]